MIIVSDWILCGAVMTRVVNGNHSHIKAILLYFMSNIPLTERATSYVK